MHSTAGLDRRGGQQDEVAEALPQRAIALSRLFLRRTSIDIARTEAAVLSAIAPGPRRITDLACSTGVTQPAITLVVNRLQERGWVSREPDPTDRRVVRVVLTSAGADTFGQLQSEYRALLREQMAQLSDDEVEVLARAVHVLDELIARLEERGD